MATLTFVTPDGAENQFELAGELSVGREVGNDVVLPEGGLSRKHCRFYEEEGQVFVEDFGSSNGTMVDGQKIAEPTAIGEGQEVLVANIQVIVSAAKARAGTPRKQASGVRKAAASNARTGQIASVPRRNPSGSGGSNLPVKRGPSTSGGRGGVPARRGSSAPAVLEDEAPAALAPSARAVLKGMTGPWAGKRFPLAKVVSVVGRVDGNDVVIDDDSVSRRHAEVRKSGQGYVVRDLNSANGTCVNNERITEAPLRPGDVVKFGVVEFSYSGPSLGKFGGGAGGSDPAKKKKLLLFGGGGLAVVLLVGFMAHEALTPETVIPDSQVGLAGSAAPAAPDTQALLGMCRSFSDSEGNTLDWKRAVDACDQVLKADPINADARKLKKLSEKELAQQKIFDHAHELFSVGQEEVSLTEFEKLDTDTYYFAQARADFTKAADSVKKRMGDACLRSDKAAEYEKAWIACKAYEDFGCYRGVEEKFQKLFLELQKRFKGKDEWTCPPKYVRWLKQIGNAGDDPRKKAIAALYTEPQLAEALNIFAHDPVAGRNALIHYRDSGKDAVRANQLLQFEDTFYSKHQSAYEKMLHDDLKGASGEIKQEVDADHAVMPKEYETDMTTADRDSLANKYAEAGKVFFTQERYEKAFDSCFAGYQFTKSNLNVSGCLANLETKAAAMDINSCGDLATVERITRPDSLAHKNASKAKADKKCP